MDPEQLLLALSTKEHLQSHEYAEEIKVDPQVVIGCIKSIQSHGENIIEVGQTKIDVIMLTEEGKKIAENGSHEFLFFQSVIKEDSTMQDLEARLKELKFNEEERKMIVDIGKSKAMKSKWIKCQNSLYSRRVETVQDDTKNKLLLIKEGKKVDNKDLKELKKRKLVKVVSLKPFVVKKGSDFKLKLEKLETELTAEMIADGSWETKKFKALNFNARPREMPKGAFHPLLKVRSVYRNIFLEMGFTEMPTNNYVESSFWNFDSLFQPQQHPARDAHDTFFVDSPATCANYPLDYMERVKKVHSQGGFGSQGYVYDWKEQEAQKNILRTHTTAVSAKMLYKLAEQEEFEPVRYFSIDRVFRNESLDATHLAEFHQVEGFIADRGLTLGDLMGILREFFKKLGMDKLRFKPAYNPYTEPSLEIFGFHPGLKKWVEIGNSGMFRPEMLLPMNLPEDVRCIAWGLSLERPTMILCGIDNIRSLCGHKIDLKMVGENPLCQMDIN